MTFEDISPYTMLIYAPFAGGCIFFSLFYISVFLGFSINQVWGIPESPKIIRIIFILLMILFPEINALVSGIYFGRKHKTFFRLTTFLTGGIFLLLEIGFLYPTTQDYSLLNGLGDVMIMRILWSPVTIFLGALSFFIFKNISFNKNVQKEHPILKQNDYRKIVILFFLFF